MVVWKQSDGRHPAQKYIKEFAGPFAIVRKCAICGHTDTVPKVLNPGRGWGFREGNKQRGRLIQHIKEKHPEAIR